MKIIVFNLTFFMVREHDMYVYGGIVKALACTSEF